MLRRIGIALMLAVAGIGALATAAGAEMARPAEAPGTAARKLAIVARMFELGRTDAVLAGWRRTLVEQGRQLAAQSGDAEAARRLREAWERGVEQAFDVTAISREMQLRLARLSSIEDLEEQAAFLDTPIGRRIIAVEAAYSTETPPDAERAVRIVKAAADLKRRPERASLMRRLLTAMKTEETLVTVLSTMQSAVALGAEAASPQGRPRLDETEIAGLVEDAKVPLRQLVSATTLPTYADMWRNLPDADLEHYARQLELPGSQHVVAASAAVYGELMQRTAFAIGGAFARELAAERL